MKNGQSMDCYRGFTLVEQLIVLFLVGILGAVSVPSFLGLWQKVKINDATESLRIAVQEVQRQAIMKSQDCTIFLPITNTFNPTLTSNCFVLGDRTLKDVQLRHNYGYKNNQIVFDYRGRANGLGTMVIDKIAYNIDHQRCLIISNFIGMSRVGYYDPDQKTGASASFCSKVDLF